MLALKNLKNNLFIYTLKPSPVSAIASVRNYEKKYDIFIPFFHNKSNLRSPKSLRQLI